MLLTVVICTYRRDKLLAIALGTLCQQSADSAKYCVLVVDNGGQATTREVAKFYGADYVSEPKLGHSHARNRGCMEANTPWVLYLDDDVQAPESMISWFLQRIETAEYAALGGAIRPWFITLPPTWSAKYFAHTKFPSPQKEIGELPEDHYLIGCLFAVRKSAWEEVGGFSDSVGMHGHAVGRADEDEFQVRLRRSGFKIYYDPDIYIDHLVQPYKYTFSGHFKLAYASGRDGVGMRGNLQLNTWGLIKRCMMITIYSVPFNLARWLFKPGYRWQNAVVDSITKYYFAWGQYFPYRRKIT